MSEPAPNRPLDLELLRSYCKGASFKSNDVLRLEGRHYREMYLITCGEVTVDRQGGPAQLINVGAGSPIGEMSFLRGCPATATVTAKTDTEVLVIDDPTFSQLEDEHPALAAHLLQVLADIAEERTNDNLIMAPSSTACGKAPEINVLLCRSKSMAERAERLRYEVYCLELGRDSPFADHQKKILSDKLDEQGYIFIAEEGGEVIGTLRLNLCREGSIGALEDLYAMRSSAHHPDATAVCTKFVIKKSKRRSPAAIKLLGAAARRAVESKIIECYIDCIPPLLPYYRAIGFRVAGPKFFHRENGPSCPMKVDIRKHGQRVSNEFGRWPYLSLYARAQMLKFRDKLLGDRALAAGRA